MPVIKRSLVGKKKSPHRVNFIYMYVLITCPLINTAFYITQRALSYAVSHQHAELATQDFFKSKFVMAWKF